MGKESFSDIGKIAAIDRLFEGSGFRAGEDLSFRPSDKSRILSFQKTFIEGTDFDLIYFPLKHLGYKCAIAVLGELAAACAVSKTLSVVLGVSSKLDFDEVRSLWNGAVTAASEFGVEKLGLDLIPSNNGLSVSVSAVGEVSCEVATRAPAPASKDLLCVSGSLGAAYLGMQVLEKGKISFDKESVQPTLEKYRMLVGAYLKPEIDSSVPGRLTKEEIFPSAGILVTRGLSDAVKRLSLRTGLGAKVYADKIPFEGNSFALGKELDIDPVSAAMNGGDDLKLLFSIPILSYEKFHKEFPTFSVIGHLALPEAGTVLVTPEGAELPLKAQGWPDEE